MKANTLPRSVGVAFALVLAAILAAFANTASAEAQAVPPIASISVSPSLPTTGDRVRLLAMVAKNAEAPYFPLGFQIERTGNTFTVTASPIPVCPNFPGPYTGDFDLGALPSGFYQVLLHSAGGDVAGSFIVSSPGQGLALDGGRFRVSLLHGAVASGTQVSGGAPAASVQLSDRSGYFWFYDSGNIEVTLKILDGSGVNGHFWLFAASTTDQPFVIEVVDTQGTCAAPPCIKIYPSPAGRNQNFIDLELFPK